MGSSTQVVRPWVKRVYTPIWNGSSAPRFTPVVTIIIIGAQPTYPKRRALNNSDQAEIDKIALQEPTPPLQGNKSNEIGD